MIIGQQYTFQWYDIEDCTIQISRDGGVTWTTIAENVITVLTEDVPLECSYTWTVSGDESRNCRTKFIDNETGQELIGELFVITSGSATTFKYTYNNVEVDVVKINSRGSKKNMIYVDTNQNLVIGNL